MNDHGPDTTRDPTVLAAIAAVTSAYEAATAAIEAMDDPDEAFQLATALWAALRAGVDANGALRARLVKRIWELHKLDLAALAQRVSVSKSRAGQFIQSAQAQEQTAQAREQGECP